MTKKHRDREWLQEEYVNKRRTLRDLGKECGVSFEAVRASAARFGIVKPKEWELIDKDWLQVEYVDNRRSQKDISGELGVSIGSVRIALSNHGIIRTPYTKEEIRVRYNEGQNRRYADNEELRKRKNATTTKWREDNKERYNAYQRNYHSGKKSTVAA